MFKANVTPKFGDLDGLRHINNNTLGIGLKLEEMNYLGFLLLI